MANFSSDPKGSIFEQSLKASSLTETMHGAHTPSSFQELLQVKKLSKSFRGVKAVDNVSFFLKEGSITGLIGPNGAGKTTLFSLLSGATESDSGDVFFEGKSLKGLKTNEICLRGIARTFQIVRPFRELTTLENVMIGSLAKTKNVAWAKNDALSILANLGMFDKRDVKAAHLTLPEHKRLEVARALATNPKILLLDEVMAGLRPGEVDHMVEILKNLNKKYNLTILLIEHVMRAVMGLSEHIIVMNHGEKIAEGDADYVTNHPKVLSCYLGEA